VEIALSEADRAFRDEVRAFLAEKYTPDLRAANARQAGVFAEPALSQRWHAILYEKGWIAPNWPKEHGGAGFSPVESYLWETACEEAKTPSIPAMGILMVGPVLMGRGSAAQREHYLPRILSGEHYWCQGYSEPGSGSDLASLQTRAVRDGDHYVVNGTKIWTTHAHFANRIFLLVRTASDGPKQQGITFLLADMKTPGISVKPIITMSGEHDVNQVFFDNVRIPVENRVGAENEGWSVAKYLLEFERGGAYAPRLKGAIGEVRAIAASESDGAAPLARQADFAARLDALEMEAEALAMTEARMVSQASRGGSLGGWAPSVIKLRGSETLQRINELAVEALAYYAAPDQRSALGIGANAAVVGPGHALTVTARYLNNRAVTVYGGASEVQRNILAKAVLGL